MPSIRNAVIKNANLSATGQLKPVTESNVEGPKTNNPEGPMLSNAVNGLPLRGVYPVSMTLDTDFQNNTQTTRTGQNMRSPLFPTRPGNAVSVQQVKTIVENVISNTGPVIPITPVPAPTPSGSGVTLQVNGTTIVQPIVDISNSAPAAPGSTTNVLFNSDTSNPTNISASMPLMVGDSGSGGKSGAVPAPTPGSTAARDYLDASGNWTQPPGTGGAPNYQQVENNGSPLPAQPILNFIGATVVNNVGNTSTDVTVTATSSAFKVENFNVTPVSVANNSSEQTLMSYTLGANELSSGQALSHMSRGQFSNLTGSTISYIFKFYIDSTVVVGGASGSLSIVNGGSGQWDLDAATMVVTSGAGGSVEVQGKFNMSLVVSTTGAMLSTSELNNSTFSFDTTTTHVFKVTVQMGAANPSALCSQRQMLDTRIGP